MEPFFGIVKYRLPAFENIVTFEELMVGTFSFYTL